MPNCSGLASFSHIVYNLNVTMEAPSLSEMNSGGVVPRRFERRHMFGINIAGYIEVLKPLPSVLLGFIGFSAAFIAGGGGFSPRLALVFFTVLVASAGANGLTNYLDRNIDARMRRTCVRVLPSGAIHPAGKVLPLIFSLMALGLGLAWYLHPYVFIADAAGTVVAATWRKKVTCVYPQGLLASCAPLFMGWLAVSQSLNWELWLLCLLIAAWLPLHVWSVNISCRDDYLQAGIHYFPINLAVKDSIKVLLALSFVLYAVSLVLYFVGDFHWLYLVLANVLGIIMVAGAVRLVASHASGDAWKLYKLSSFPYLGILFLVMCLDIWLIK
jgi:protoheme IX farnesyltransferase